jgi:hypothetical protein
VSRRAAAALVAVAVAVALSSLAGASLAGCGGDDARPSPSPSPSSTATSRPAASATPTSTPTPAPRAARRRARVPRALCPGGTPDCATVRGRVVYVERVDPDGDGDLHVVVLAGHVTAPGATAIDVAVDLRPRRDPRIGDVVSAAGPVQRGHLGQAQIHALVFHAQRR